LPDGRTEFIDTPTAKPGEPVCMFEIIGSFDVGELRMEKAVDQDIQARA
jgi:hypothetical protein